MYDLTKDDRIAELERANELQERRILELRAQLAEAEKRVAQKDAFILRLERRQAAQRVSPRQKAEAAFRG